MSETYGQRLRQVRERAGLSQQQAAERTHERPGRHLTRQLISKYENDRAMPGADVIPALAFAYGVDVAELVP